MTVEIFLWIAVIGAIVGLITAKIAEVYMNRIKYMHTKGMGDELKNFFKMARKYGAINYRAGTRFVGRHPISERRGQKFLESRCRGMAGLVETAKYRRRPAKIKENPAKRRYHGRRPMKRIRLTRIR